MANSSVPPTSVRRGCTKCGTEKDIDEFYPRKAGRLGRQSACKVCVKADAAARYAARYAASAPGGTAVKERTCSRCRVVKSTREFSRNHWTCRGCQAELARQRRAADPLLTVRAHLRFMFRMTLEQYESMLEAQGGGCAVCTAPPRRNRLHVDHDHACCPGKRSCGRCVRGLVCYPCNVRLALFDGQSAYAVRLRAYLGVEVRPIE